MHPRGVFRQPKQNWSGSPKELRICWPLRRCSRVQESLRSANLPSALGRSGQLRPFAGRKHCEFHRIRFFLRAKPPRSCPPVLARSLPEYLRARAIGAANKTRRNRRVRQERLERSMPIIGVLRSATQDNPSNSLQRPQLQEIIAQACWWDARTQPETCAIRIWHRSLALMEFGCIAHFIRTGKIRSRRLSAAVRPVLQGKKSVLLTDARTPRLCRGGSRTGHRPGGARLGNSFAGAAVPVPDSGGRPARVLAGGTQFLARLFPVGSPSKLRVNKYLPAGRRGPAPTHLTFIACPVRAQDSLDPDWFGPWYSASSRRRTPNSRNTSEAKKLSPLVGTMMICSLSDNRSAMIF